MNEDEIKDFEDFYGLTKEKAIALDKKYPSLEHLNLNKTKYEFNKFLYPLLKKNVTGTDIFIALTCEGWKTNLSTVYKAKKEYKEKVKFFTNRALEFRKKTLDVMRRREMFYPDHYDYMTDIRTINREMHSLMPFKDYLFETLTQMDNKNE